MALYRGMITSMESETPDFLQSSKTAALLTGLGFGENLENALWMNQPEVFAAYEELVSGNTINLEQLAAEYGYNIGDLMGIKIPEGYKMALIDGTPSLVNTTDQALMAAGDAVVAQGDNLEDLMSSMWDHVFDTSYSEISGWKGDLVTLLEGMGVEAGDVLGMALPEGVAQGLALGTISVDEAAAAILAAAMIAKVDSEQAAKENAAAGEDVGGGVATGEEKATPKVKTASEGVHDAVYDQIEPLKEEVPEIAEEAFDGAETAVEEAEAPISEAAGATTQAAVDAASDALNHDAGHGIGADFGQGLADGISSKEGTIAEAGRSAAQAAYNAAAEELDINSPSRVMAWVGEMFGEGFAEGIDDTQQEAVERAQAMADGAADALARRAELQIDFDAEALVRKAQAALDREQLRITAVADAKVGGALYAKGGDAEGGHSSIVIEEIHVHTESLNNEQDWRGVSRAMAEEAERQLRLKGVIMRR